MSHIDRASRIAEHKQAINNIKKVVAKETDSKRQLLPSISINKKPQSKVVVPTPSKPTPSKSTPAAPAPTTKPKTKVFNPASVPQSAIPAPKNTIARGAPKPVVKRVRWVDPEFKKARRRPGPKPHTIQVFDEASQRPTVQEKLNIIHGRMSQSLQGRSRFTGHLRFNKRAPSPVITQREPTPPPPRPVQLRRHLDRTIANIAK